MQRHILVPLDGSALAETVLPHAVRLAQATERVSRGGRIVSWLEA